MHLPITPSPTEDSQSPISYTELQVHRSAPAEGESLPKFELAPTPAQLGLRRSGRKVNPSDEQFGNASSTTQLAQVDEATEISTAEVQTTSTEFNFKERFRTLPQFDYDNYKSPTQWTGSPWPPTDSNLYKKRHVVEPDSAAFDAQGNDSHDIPDPRSSSTRNLSGNRFFGPDFNLANLNGKNWKKLSPDEQISSCCCFFFFFTISSAKTCPNGHRQG